MAKPTISTLPSGLDLFNSGLRQKPGAAPKGQKAAGGGGAKGSQGPKGAGRSPGSKRGRRARQKGEVDGEEFLRSALQQMRVRSARGEEVWAVFAIDNTLCSTHQRTIALAKAWDARNGTAYFDRLTLDNVGHDARETSDHFGLPGKAAAAFCKHWEMLFPEPSSFAMDLAIRRTLQLCKAVVDNGGDVVVLTARPQSQREATLQQLRRLGLPDHSTSLFCRPDGAPPMAYKAEQLERWRASGVHLSWYMGERRKEIAFLQRRISDLACVLVELPLSREDAVVRANTPILMVET